MAPAPATGYRGGAMRCNFLCSSLFLFLGCSSAAVSTGVPEAGPAASASGASASLVSNAGVAGTVQFAPEGDTVRVKVELTGLQPGPHGFHIHEAGDCSAEDFTSAGGHFNPHGRDHGAPSDDQRHAGDFGNIEASADGVVSVELEMDVVLDPAAADSVIGKAVIVHAEADDLKSQPSGAAGPRVACGVISPAV